MRRKEEGSERLRRAQSGEANRFARLINYFTLFDFDGKVRIYMASMGNR
jgi:hypothetical protein